MAFWGGFGVYFGPWKAPLVKELARRYDETEDFFPDDPVFLSRRHSSKKRKKSKF
jgi:hypothetical protein